VAHQDTAAAACLDILGLVDFQDILVLVFLDTQVQAAIAAAVFLVFQGLAALAAIQVSAVHLVIADTAEHLDLVALAGLAVFLVSADILVQVLAAIQAHLALVDIQVRMAQQVHLALVAIQAFQVILELVVTAEQMVQLAHLVTVASVVTVAHLAGRVSADILVIQEQMVRLVRQDPLV
jgi:hypothetical protein